MTMRDLQTADNPIEMTEWQKKIIPTDMWETTLTEASGNKMKVSVFGVKRKGDIQTQNVVSTALCIRDTLHLWQEQIICEVVSLSRECTADALRESMKLAHVLFDNEHRLSAIYFDTPLLYGHQIVVEFDGAGEPYEAEIAG